MNWSLGTRCLLTFYYPEAKPMGRSRYKILDEAYPYFHTLTVAGWQPVFTRQCVF
jgi:hypothetical protein